MINITYGQTCSDETSIYRVDISKPMTVGQFIDEYMAGCPNNWGYFGVRDGESIFGNPKCEYSHGEIKGKTLPKDILNRNIKKVHGSGGWSRSDFQFELCEEIK